MAKDIDIKVKASGAKKTAADIRDTARAEHDLGKGAKGASKGIRQASEAMDELTRGLGVNKSIFTNWQVGLAAGLATLVAALKESHEYLSRIHAEMRSAFREFSDLTRQPGTVQLAQIRGATEAATVDWMYRTGEKYAISPQEARTAAFEIESGLDPTKVGGKAAFGRIEDAAFRVMRGFGASGRTAAGLGIAAYESGLAMTPEEFRRFYAQAGIAAGKSRLSLESLGGILTETLPMAVKAGIPADYFMAQASAMSFRIGDPSRLRTALRQMIAAAGIKGPSLEQYAAAAGRQLADMSAVDIMELQSRQISGALASGGPQAANLMAESLGLPRELAQVYGAAFDPAVQARMRGLRGMIGGAAWSDVAGRYAGVRGTQSAREYATRIGEQRSRQMMGRSQGLMTVAENLARTRVNTMLATGQDIPGVLEDLPGGQGRATRMYMLHSLQRILGGMAADESLGADVRAEAAGMHEDIFEDRGLISGDIPGGYQILGNAEREVMGAFRFAQTHGITINRYNGGVQFIGQYSDQAGELVPSGME